jgi:copper(I)-binding protein
VKPIVGNKAIESIERIDFTEAALPFDTYKLDEVSKLSQNDLEVHLTQVYKALHKSAVNGQSNTVTVTVTNALTDRLNILGYLANIAASAEVSYHVRHMRIRPNRCYLGLIGG